MAERVLRVDRLSLDWGVTPVAPGRARAKLTPEGYLDVDAYIARDGLLKYSDGTKSWMELRPRAALEAAAASWANKPVTDDHPPVMVDSTNASTYARGHIMGTPYIVDVDGVAYLAARLRVMDAALVRKIVDDGRHELSVGFMAVVEPRVGVHDGVRYDAVQELDDESGNHVASVDRGRAGPAVRVLLDSARDSAESCYHTQVKPDHEVPPVSKPTLDSARATRVIKLPAGTKMDAVKAWCDNAQAKIPNALADEVGIPTTKAMLVGPDGTEMEVATWIAALVAEALDARKAGGAAAAPAIAEGEMPEAPEDAAGEPAMPPDDKDKKMPEMTPDQITALVRRRGRLERLSAAAGLPSAVIDSADDTALARAYVAHVLPHAKARVDAADGAVLDALVEVASSTPVAVTVNPFEVSIKTDAADDEPDPIVEAYAAHLSS